MLMTRYTQEVALKCSTMFNEFEMMNNGLMFYFLSIKVKQQHDGIFISQEVHEGDLEEIQNE